ncbi:hypothetical protein CHS0354_018367 [Potamilus streckersoni]|uniref:histidinol-phosphatase n=1 Tax=Potamilus streckersoni TaxID=2493646 RepID=A0AAE0TBM5_9BIVA|nr:hypothetical protein CHS0354_018367 [Potamilus streckersoni]
MLLRCTIFASALLFTALLTVSCKVEVEAPTGYDTICTDNISSLVNSSMRWTAVYGKSESSCTALKDPDDSAYSEYYADSSCQQKINYSQQSFESLCYDLVNSNTMEVGNPAKWADTIKQSDTETNWFMSQWAKLKIYAYPQYTLKRPLVKEVVYSTPSDAAGNTCSLTARIYKADMEQTNTPTAVVIHGGGWEERGLQAEVMNDIIATIYTDKGYTVFAPYYRLTATTGTAGCINASGTEILTDIESFYTWLTANASVYKANANNILVHGNSAGAHLAAHLAASHSSNVKNAVLFYGPLDMNFVVAQYRAANGIYSADIGTTGNIFLSQYLKTTNLKLTPDISTDLIRKGTYTDKTLGNVFIVQGSGDTLVKPETALRLCEAKSGSTLSTTAYTYSATDASRACGTNTDKSRLYMIQGANHMMDIYIPCTGEYNSTINKLLFDTYDMNACNNPDAATHALKKDGHVHSQFCPHGSRRPTSEFIDSAVKSGFDEISVTEHAPLPDRYIDDPALFAELNLTEPEIEPYLAHLAELKKVYSGRIRILTGFEIDYLPGREAETLPEMIDYRPEVFENTLIKPLGSVCAVYEAYLKEYRQLVNFAGSLAEKPRLAHPMLIWKFCRAFPLSAAEEAALEDILISDILPDAARSGLSIDFNVAGLDVTACGRAYVSARMVQTCAKLGIPLIYGSDAHAPDKVGRYYNTYTAAVLRR